MSEAHERVDRVFLDALLLISERLEAADVVWAVTGSLGHALQGVPVEVHDIDLQTDEPGAYVIERRLAEFIVRPVAESPADRIRSQFGELAVGGVKVEVMGAVQKRTPDGSWEPPVPVARHRVHVSVAGRRIPVLSLAYECLAYEALGRRERAALLRRHAGGGRNRDG